MLLAMALLFGVTDLVPAAGARTVETVVESDVRHVRLTVSGLDATWQAHPLRDGALVLHEVSVPGFTNVGVPGRVRLPVRSGWLVVPPGTDPVVETVREQWQDGERQRLMIEPTPVMIRLPDADDSFPADRFLMPGEAPPPGGVVPPDVLARQRQFREPTGGPAIELGEPVPWRGRRIVPYTITPVQTDGTGHAERLLTGGTWDVNFVATSKGYGEPLPAYGRKTDDRGDDRFGFLFRNGDQLAQLPPEAAAGYAAPAQSAKAAALRETQRTRGAGAKTDLPEVQLRIKRTQMYRVEARDLINSELLPETGVQEAQLRLYQRRYLPELATTESPTNPPYLEIEVPLVLVGDGGEFSGNDFFLFYGLRPRDDGAFDTEIGGLDVTVPDCGDPQELANEYNVYWLAVAEPPEGEQWARMPTTTLPPAAGAPRQHYRRTDHFELAEAFRENVPSVAADRIYYNDWRASEVVVPLNKLWSPDPATTDGLLEVGLTSYNGLEKRLDLSFEINDVTTFIDTFIVQTLDELVFSTPVSGALLSDFPDSYYDDFSASLRVIQEGSTRIQAYVNWADISYDALYNASDDELTFIGGDGSGTVDLEVTGFSSADLGLVDVTDPRQPVWIELAAANIVPDGDLYALSLQVDESGEVRRFFARTAMTDAGVPEIVYREAELVANPVCPLEFTGEVPDLIVITHPKFRSALQRWIDYRLERAGGDLSIHTVEIQDLYNWYSGGLHDYWAIKRFVEYAIAEWGSWALVLVGDANENVRKLGVSAEGLPFAEDWVPTHLHIQNTSSELPELLATDKWFATPSASADYPNGLPVVTDMYVGRFPCNSVAELDIMIDKVMTVENVQPGQSWRRRAIFMADDAYNLNSNPAYFNYDAPETIFDYSMETTADWWAEHVDLGLDAERELLSTYLEEFGYPDDPPLAGAWREIVEEHATPPLLTALSAGALMVSFQGHANPNLLTHEYWFVDKDALERNNVLELTNLGRPFFFFGLGCHISDWAQNPVSANAAYPKTPSIGEKLLIHDGGGAYATYASSGFEYRGTNRRFWETIMQRWLFAPPAMTVTGEAVRSRWVLGELMWAAEADELSKKNTTTRMVAQYVLLGDPLTVLDCGAPRVSVAFAEGGPLADGDELFAADAGNQRQLRIEALDEAGIDRLVLVAGDGSELPYSIAVVESPLSADVTADQGIAYDLDVPIQPFDHDIVMHVYDTADRLETDDHFQLTLHVSQSATFLAAGEPVEMGEYQFTPAQPVEFTAEIVSAAWLSDTSVLSVEGENLEIGNLQISHDKGRNISLGFRATAPDASDIDRGIVLTIDDFATKHLLYDTDQESAPSGVTDLFSFPNPMIDRTRFVFRSDAPAGDGRVRIFSVAGRVIRELEFDFSGAEEGAVSWDGRDDVGDVPANGVYFYRIEIDTSAGRTVSDVQRLVIMR